MFLTTIFIIHQTIQSAILPKLGSPNPCNGLPNGVFVNNPKGCEYFYYCDHGNAKEVRCPGDLWFDEDAGICERQENVDCKLNDPPTIPPPTDVENVVCPLVDTNELTFIGSSIVCERYFICYHGKALPQDCVEGMHWNWRNNKCDYPKEADCRVIVFIQYYQFINLKCFLYILVKTTITSMPKQWKSILSSSRYMSKFHLLHKWLFINTTVSILSSLGYSYTNM